MEFRGGCLHSFRMKINCVEQVVKWRLCMGCGACMHRCPQGSIELVNVLETGIRPWVDTNKCQVCGECIAVCPGIKLEHSANSDKALKILSKSWGPVRQVWEGYSNDEEIRFKGSSGGVATALALYALEKENVSGVLQVGSDPSNPLENKAALNTTRESLVQCAGSRYAPAPGCENINLIRESLTPCVFIGKPCEVAALKKLRSSDSLLDSKIAFTISIFCAGTPSLQGTMELLKQFDVRRNEVESVRYRGCGWPGNAAVKVKGTGRLYELSYAQAWGDILSKHGQLRCRLCPDGTGEFADIACGDPWYRKIEPDEKGRSLVLVRTKKGQEILDRAVRAEYIQLQKLAPETLPKSQKSLLWRRRHLWGRLAVMLLMGVPVPRYEGFFLFRNWLQLSLGEKLRSVGGTLRRIVIRRWRKPLWLDFTQEQAEQKEL